MTGPGLPDYRSGNQDRWLVWCSAGYWLVYQPARDRFHCFWCSEVDVCRARHLRCPGMVGQPKICLPLTGAPARPLFDSYCRDACAGSQSIRAAAATFAWMDRWFA